MRYPLISRRSFLRAAGVSLALPTLEAMSLPSWAADAKNQPQRRRMVAIDHTYSFYAPKFFPEKPGRDYKLSPLLEPLKDLKNDFTVFFGLSHPNVGAGHHSDTSYLSAAFNRGQSSDKHSISLDQFIAERIGSETRFGSMVLVAGGDYTYHSVSFTRTGVNIPAWGKPPAVFARLFLTGTPQEIKTQVVRLNEGRSIMDSVCERAKRLQKKVGTRDRDKLDEYFTAVRECEQSLHKAQAWAVKPKPKVSMAQPKPLPPHDLVGDLQQMYDLMHLALKTDSTRAITLYVSDYHIPPIAGVKEHYHALSHHGNQANKLEQLHLIEIEQMKAFQGFLTKLKSTEEDGETLLDRTAVLCGSHLGDANGHDARNLPIILAGGRFKHGQFLKYGAYEGNRPLANLFVGMLRHMGMEIDRFGSSTGSSYPGFALKA